MKAHTHTHTQSIFSSKATQFSSQSVCLLILVSSCVRETENVCECVHVRVFVSVFVWVRECHLLKYWVEQTSIIPPIPPLLFPKMQYNSRTLGQNWAALSVSWCKAAILVICLEAANCIASLGLLPPSWAGSHLDSLIRMSCQTFDIIFHCELAMCKI